MYKGKVAPLPAGILDTEEAIDYVIKLWTSLSTHQHVSTEYEIKELNALGFRSTTYWSMFEEVMDFLKADAASPANMNGRKWGRCTIQ